MKALAWRVERVDFLLLWDGYQENGSDGRKTVYN
jgi:hypothetical protein